MDKGKMRTNWIILEMKWMKGAKERIVVAGGQGQGNSLAQLSGPTDVIVDRLGIVYVADSYNNRIVHWCKGAREGNLVIDGNGEEEQANQFSNPGGLSFDREGKLYVVDYGNHRVQRFDLIIFQSLYI
jgi:sugar lactone lactonase YvrE